MKIIDISWPISPDMTGYNNRKEVIFNSTKLYEAGGVRESNLIINTHAGTHVEVSSHISPQGASIDSLNLDKIIGSAFVIDVTHIEHKITQEDLESYPLSKNLIILFKTKNSELIETAHYESNVIYLDESAASYCIEKGVKAIGIDYLDIEPHKQKYATHKLLLDCDIPLIEGLRLNHVVMGYYFFVCLPLYVEGLEAAPARAVLFQEL